LLDLHVGGSLTESEPIICAAHPADTFTEKAVALLQETTQFSAVCVNPRSAGLEDMVDELEEARRQLAIERWVFWGISGGG